LADIVPQRFAPDQDVKEQAMAALAAVGLSASDAVRRKRGLKAALRAGSSTG